MTTCPECGAIASGELMGFPVLVHKEGCSQAPQPLKAADIEFMMLAMPSKRYLCTGCGATWDRRGEAVHALDCPANSLRN